MYINLYCILFNEFDYFYLLFELNCLRRFTFILFSSLFRFFKLFFVRHIPYIVLMNYGLHFIPDDDVMILYIGNYISYTIRLWYPAAHRNYNFYFSSNSTSIFILQISIPVANK